MFLSALLSYLYKDGITSDLLLSGVIVSMTISGLFSTSIGIAIYISYNYIE